MEEIKRKYEFYSYYDCSGIEKHLKKMAEKGWMLKEIGTRLWKYRRIEPQSLSFSVVYYKGKVYEGEITADRQRFIDEHSVAGWQFVTNTGKMHVFANESENPVPMHTDAAERVREIHRFAKGSMIWENLFMVAVAVIITSYFTFRFFEKPIDTMSDAAYIFWPLLLFIPLSAYGIVKYLFWYMGAKKSAEDGIFIETKRIFNYANFYIPLYFTVATLKFYTFLSPSQMLFGVIAFAFAIVVWLVYKSVRRGIIRKDAADKKKRALTAATAVALAAVFVAGSLGIYSLFPKRIEKITTADGETAEIFCDKNLPLDLEDLIPVDGTVSKHKSLEWLGFISVTETSQFVPDNDDSELTCDIYYINYAAVYDACKEEIQNIRKEWYVKTDPALWGADEVYRLCYDDEPTNRYVVCWPDRIVEISFGWEPTDEQIAIASGKLMNAEM